MISYEIIRFISIFHVCAVSLHRCWYLYPLYAVEGNRQSALAQPITSTFDRLTVNADTGNYDVIKIWH